MAKIAREVCPEAVIVFGGAHEIHCAEFTVGQNPHIDISVKGRGAQAFKEIADAILGDSGKPLEEVDGIAFRKGAEVVLTKPRAWKEELPHLPRHLL
jgi:radical SAM superfamily enzyme YgiQ (UPF0313 family)